MRVSRRHGGRVENPARGQLRGLTNVSDAPSVRALGPYLDMARRQTVTPVPLPMRPAPAQVTGRNDATNGTQWHPPTGAGVNLASHAERRTTSNIRQCAVYDIESGFHALVNSIAQNIGGQVCHRRTVKPPHMRLSLRVGGGRLEAAGGGGGEEAVHALLELGQVQDPDGGGGGAAADGGVHHDLVADLDRADAVALGVYQGGTGHLVGVAVAVGAVQRDGGAGHRRDLAVLERHGLVAAAGLGHDDGAVHGAEQAAQQATAEEAGTAEAWTAEPAGGAVDAPRALGRRAGRLRGG